MKTPNMQFLFGLGAAVVALFIYNLLAGRNTMDQGRLAIPDWFIPTA